MVRIFLACFLFCLTFPVHAFSADTWAVYWYICGSDLESEHGSASADIAELLRARLPDNVTVVLQTGGTKKWQNGISSKKISRFVYRGKDLELVDTQPQASMGSGKTLASFPSVRRTIPRITRSLFSGITAVAAPEGSAMTRISIMSLFP